MNSRRSAQDLVKPLKAEGYGSTLGNTTMSVDDLRKAIKLASTGDDDALALVIARLAPFAWQTAHCLSSNTDTAQAATSQGLVTLVKQISSNRGEYDPSVEVVRTTREALSSGVVAQPTKNRFLSRFRSKKTVGPAGALDRRAEIAFAALPEDLRFLLWHLEVRHFTPATVARISGKATREVEDGRRNAALGFRRYYIEAMSRENMSLECSAALDLVPDYASSRLDHAAVVSLESHFEKCPECKETATKLRALEGRLLDAMPAIDEAALEAAALALITDFGQTATVVPEEVKPKHIRVAAPAPVAAVEEAAQGEPEAVAKVDAEAAPAETAEVAPVEATKAKSKRRKNKRLAEADTAAAVASSAAVATSAAATAVVAAPVVIDSKDEAVTAIIDIRDHSQPEVVGFGHDEEEPIVDSPKRYADDQTWWLRERRRPAVAIGAAAVVLSVIGTALFASRNDPANETANESVVTTTVVPATTAAPAVTETTIGPPVTPAPVVETPPTTAAPAAAPSTTQAQRQVVTPTTQRPAPTTTRPPATTAAPTTTTTRPPNFAIVDLPTTTTAVPPTTTAPPAPQQ